MSSPGERSFEQALAALEDCVRQLDAGELPLETALRIFEDGVKLQRECQELLNESEQKLVALSTPRRPDDPSDPNGGKTT